MYVCVRYSCLYICTDVYMYAYLWLVNNTKNTADCNSTRNTIVLVSSILRLRLQTTSKILLDRANRAEIFDSNVCTRRNASDIPFSHDSIVITVKLRIAVRIRRLSGELFDACLCRNGYADKVSRCEFNYRMILARVAIFYFDGQGAYLDRYEKQTN